MSPVVVEGSYQRDSKRALARVVAICSEAFDVSAGDVSGSARWRRASMARHAAVYVALRALGLSLPQLGRLMRRHHTTVLASRERAKDLRATDPAFRAVLSAAEARARAELAGSMELA